MRTAAFAEDIPEGDYRLEVSIHEEPPDNACGWGRLLGVFSREFTVRGGAQDAPLDLGGLEPVEVGGPSLHVGDPAPKFTVKTLDGKTCAGGLPRSVCSARLLGDLVSPCVAEMPNLRAVHDAFANDSRFVMVSLSLDEKPADVAYFLKQQPLPWRQGVVGPDADVVASYGATAIPATFLIGPVGKSSPGMSGARR